MALFERRLMPCDHCGKSVLDRGVLQKRMMCSLCRAVGYCSEECQRAAWEGGEDAAEWEAEQLHQYGLIAVDPRGDAMQLEKVTYDVAKAYLPADVTAVGTSLGSFSVSAALMDALTDEFAAELKAKDVAEEHLLEGVVLRDGVAEQVGRLRLLRLEPLLEALLEAALSV